jgi:hypothetical protein
METSGELFYSSTIDFAGPGFSIQSRPNSLRPRRA